MRNNSCGVCRGGLRTSRPTNDDGLVGGGLGTARPTKDDGLVGGGLGKQLIARIALAYFTMGVYE